MWYHCTSPARKASPTLRRRLKDTLVPMRSSILLVCLVTTWVASQAFLQAPGLVGRPLAVDVRFSRGGRKNPAPEVCRWRLRSRGQDVSMSSIATARAVADAESGVATAMWKWGEYDIRYKVAGKDTPGPAMILIHGFGGNADHWRKSMPALSKIGPVYAIDLLGYGFSSKPDPGPWEQKNALYNFETWSKQVLDFAKEVVGDKVFIVCNSVGGVAGLQAGLDKPDQVMGVVLFNLSLRMLHEKKQPTVGKPFVKSLQYILRETPVGNFFFNSVAKSRAVSNILKQCYGDEEAVTDELVNCILKPGLEPGAVKVFLDFISYSSGPLPEELLGEIKVPVVIGWGDEDPWEPISLGRAYAAFDAVEDFIVIPGAGHCPMDEAPHLTDPVVIDFVRRHSPGPVLA